MTHVYTPEELDSLARKVGAKSITVTGPDIADDSVDVTAVRKALIEESYKLLERRHVYFNVLRRQQPLPGEAPVHAYEALADAGCWKYAVAGMLRQVAHVDPALAGELAGFAAGVLENGIEALEDANDDLPEPVAAEAVAR